MNVPGLIFLILFGVVSLVHLFFCYKENEKLRAITKPFCLLMLIIAAIILVPSKPLIYVGAILGLIGDIFMLFKHNKICFAFGTFVFLGGHFLYIAQAILSLSYQINYIAYIVVPIALVALAFLIYPLTKKMCGILALPGNFYMMILLTGLAFGIMLAVDNTAKPLPGILMAIGYASFFISDTILSITTFAKDVKRRDFYIMLSYLLGEFLIVFGLLAVTILA